MAATPTATKMKRVRRKKREKSSAGSSDRTQFTAQYLSEHPKQATFRQRQQVVSDSDTSRVSSEMEAREQSDKTKEKRGVHLKEAEDAQRGHVFRGLDRLEADERDLHREKCTDHVEGAVGDVDARREASREEEDEDVQWDQVDDEDVAAPRGYL
jgi:hypothetical protein